MKTWTKAETIKDEEEAVAMKGVDVFYWNLKDWS